MTTTVSAARPGNTRLFARAAAEAVGTLFLVLIALGVPIFTLPQSNPLPAPLAGGLAVTAAMFAFGSLSGGHFNPAITVGNLIAGRTRIVDGLVYLGAQLLGGLAGAFVLFAVVRTVPKITDSRAAFDTVASGFGEHSVIQSDFAGVLLLEVVGTALLAAVYLGTAVRDDAERKNGTAFAAPLAVGLTVAVLLQLGQAAGNLAFNPARATAAAVFSSGWAGGQLGVFWVAPLIGAAIAGLAFRGFAILSAPAGDASAPSGDGQLTPEVQVDAVPEAPEEASGDEAARASAPSAARAGVAPEPDEARDFFDGKRG